jgi:hypothetical protein
MSSTRNQKKAAGAPPPERKAAPGPVLTPQVLLVICLLILIAGVIFYATQIVKKSNEKLAALDSRINTAKTQKDTYTKKRGKLEIARKLNTTVREKLQTVTYMFMTDQDSMIPFWEDDFYPILAATPLAGSAEATFKVDKYIFNINMAMKPFNTLPPSRFFEDANSVFPIQYHGEQNGVPEDTPLDTRPKDFLTPYTVKMEKFRGTYKDVRDFVETLQRKTNKVFYTVHCFANDEGKNIATFRTSTEWTIVFTVYFINPEASASGDDPPSPPGAESC